MKYYGKIIIRTVLLGLITIGGTFAQAQDEWLFASYNIDADLASWDGGRNMLVINQIDDIDADVVGLQEATSQHKSDIADALGYKYDLIDFNHGHHDNNFEPVLVKRDRFRVLDYGAFEVPLACQDEGVGDRFVNWVILTNNATGLPFMFFNNHFCTQQKSVLGVNANEMHAIMLSQVMTAIRAGAGVVGGYVGEKEAEFPLPMVVAGSFNALRTDSSVSFLLDKMPIMGFTHFLDIADTWEIAHPGVPKPSTVKKIVKAGVQEGAVDYVLVEPAANVRVLDAQVVEEGPEAEIWPSDHLPVTGLLSQW